MEYIRVKIQQKKLFHGKQLDYALDPPLQSREGQQEQGSKQ